MNRGRVAEEDVAEDIEEAFVEQAEYIKEEDLLAWSVDHPEEDQIIQKLCSAGAKLLVGPRGCGKTTLMRKAYFRMLRDEDHGSLPIYVNFKLSLRLEPLYVNTANATFWFEKWLILKIYSEVWKTLKEMNLVSGLNVNLLSEIKLSKMLNALEGGNLTALSSDAESISTGRLLEDLHLVLEQSERARVVILLDDAAHAFSAKQQEDFFDFFRRIKTREVSPKAAIYPGITSHSPTFHVGHDAEQIDVWLRPDAPSYISFMHALIERRFPHAVSALLKTDEAAIEFLAFAAFGVPRSFLNMLRHLLPRDIRSTTRIDRRTVLAAARFGREAAHNVYDSLESKLPAYKEFVRNGNTVYEHLLSQLKEYNKLRQLGQQAKEVAIGRPVPNEISKVIGFLQYAGLLMPIGENSRGVKGIFDIYLVHYADLAVGNVVVGQRSKNLDSFVAVFRARTHQNWPRIAASTLVPDREIKTLFRLSLPNCQACGAERVREDAKFCHSCGSQLKTASLYEQLIGQDISVLPLTARRVASIKANSRIRTIKDIILDISRQELRNVPYIGRVWAVRIARYAEEHVA